MPGWEFALKEHHLGVNSSVDILQALFIHFARHQTSGVQMWLNGTSFADMSVESCLPFPIF